MKSSLILFLLTVISLMSCQSTASIEANDYQKLMDKESLSEYVRKKVQLEVKICKMEMQHMLIISLEGKRTYICLGRLSNKGEEFGQLLAYTSDENILKKDFENDKFIALGTVQMISGAGKGGGIHKEYYLELDAVK